MGFASGKVQWEVHGSDGDGDSEAVSAYIKPS